MPEHTIGTREQWQAARDELATLEAEQAELDRKVVKRRRQLPWVPVEKQYRFDTEDGSKTLAELRLAQGRVPRLTVVRRRRRYTTAPELRGTPAAPEPLASISRFHTDEALVALARGPYPTVGRGHAEAGWNGALDKLAVLLGR